MKSIRIKNFRSLKDTGYIDIKPITILVGKNSAGKSSFMRTFPLFKQSVAERTKSPILLYSRDGVDFGTFKDVKSIFSQPNEYIEFSFKFENVEFDKEIFNHRFFSERNISSNVIIEMKIDSINDTPILKELDIKLLDVSIQIEFDVQSKTLKSISIDEEVISFSEKIYYKVHDLVPNKFFLSHNNKDSDIISIKDLIKNELKKYISPKFRKATSQQTISNLIEKNIILDTKEESLKSLKKFNESKTWINNIKKISLKDEFFQKIYNYTILGALEEILTNIDSTIKHTFQKVKYIEPLRATAERYYRIQDLAVEEVDSNGKNLPMFLGSLSSLQMRKFQNWTHEHFGFKVRIEKSGGHYSIKIVYDEYEVNISDMGFGYSQILPIITQLWYSTEQKNTKNKFSFIFFEDKAPITFVIEQPELHLHPEFQAKFIDLIVKLVSNDDFNINIIMETHSQTIVNRLGMNIAKQVLSIDKTNIVIFNKDNENKPTEVSVSKYDNDGFLLNWPIGFFKPSRIEK